MKLFEPKKKKKSSDKRNVKKWRNSYPTEITPLYSNIEDASVLTIQTNIPTTMTNELDKARKILYVSHLIAKMADLCWQFCIILFLTALTNFKSLTLVSSYGITCGILSCISGSITGKFIDAKDHDRLFIAFFFIAAQNLCVVFATIACYLLLSMCRQEDVQQNKPQQHVLYHNVGPHFTFEDFSPPLNGASIFLLISLHILGAMAKVLDDALTVVVERDWIVVMSKIASYKVIDDNITCTNNTTSPSKSVDHTNHTTSKSSSSSSLSINNTRILKDLKEKTWLSQTNMNMTQIDLLCKVFAPTLAGIFIAFFDKDKNVGSDLASGALLIGILNIISLIVELKCARLVYELIPSLGVRSTDITDTQPNKVLNQEMRDDIEKDILSNSKANGCGIFSSFRIIGKFFEQPIWPAGISLALLYLNVLTFGSLMTGYLVWKGMSFESIGMWRGISSLIGLSGTLAFYISNNTLGLGLATTGMWSVGLQFSCLGICFLSLLVQSNKIALVMLIGGVCTSRMGLWVFDLAIKQQMQQLVPEHVRGLIGGIQNSINGFCDLTTYVIGLLFSNPSEFGIFIATGFFSVGFAVLFYMFGVYFRRNELKIS